MVEDFAHAHNADGGSGAEQRLRDVFDGLGDGFLSVDADWRLADCNGQAERLLHGARGELIGRKLWGLAGLPKDSPLARLARRVAARRRPAEAEIAYHPPGGAHRVLFVRVFPLGGGFAAVLRDVTRARAAERRIARAQARYREVADGTPAASWMSRADGKLVFVNQAMADSLGRPADELLGEGWMAAIDENDRESLLAARAHARETHGPLCYEGRFRRPDGELRIIRLLGRPRFDETGAFHGLVGMATDVTQARAAEARQRLLIGELNHRVKNALATVRSIVRQTLLDYGVPRAVDAAIGDRIMALSEAQDVLTRENWVGADLADIAEEATRPYSHEGRIRCAGPRARISPKTAIALSMALHELATNAVKYGALSHASGRVQLSWERTDDAALIEWREIDGPPVATPKHSGFGSRLLGPILEGELGAPAELIYAPSGVISRIRAPIEPA